MGFLEQQPRPELILRGQLQDLDLSTLLSALRLGRQYLTLELFDAAGESKGTVAVKSGRVISALTGDLSGAAAVQQLLESHGAAEFRVQMQPSGPELEAEPLGTIAELAQPRASDTDVEALPARTQILQGTLNQRLTLDEVLRVVAFTRQHVSVELSDREGNILGEVRAKSGKILSARAGDLFELPALQQLLRASTGTSFVLFTEAEGVAHLRPLGSLAEVLSRAHEEITDSPAPQTNGFRKTLPPPLPRATRPSASPSPSPRRARILEGSLDEFEPSHVLKVLSTSRQHFELHVRDDAAGSSGVIEVKSGIVLGASTEKLTGLAAARELLQARKGRFVAIRRAESTGNRPALVSVSELLQPTAASRDSDDPEDAFEDTPALSLTNALLSHEKKQATDAPAPIPVLHGKLGDLDVASILHVAGASRQYTCVDIFDDQRRPLGVIHLKSGHVVRAEAQDVTGVAAVRRLLHSPRDFSYLVQRYPSASEVTSSIGSIANVLERAATLVNPVKPASVATTSSTTLTPVASSQPKRTGAPNSSWMGGAVLGAGFVLLGGIATAVVLRSPALNVTTVSPVSAPPQQTAPTGPIPIPPPARTQEPSVQPATPAANSGAPSTEATPSASRAAIASFQAGLRQLGYETGPIDGVAGPLTTAALKAFQYAEHLTVDGTLSAPTRAVLQRRISEP